MPPFSVSGDRESHAAVLQDKSRPFVWKPVGQKVYGFCRIPASIPLLTKDATSIKRLAYIARRIRFMQELQVRGVIFILDIDGKANPADALTKHCAPKALCHTYMAHLYNTTSQVFKCAS